MPRPKSPFCLLATTGPAAALALAACAPAGGQAERGEGDGPGRSANFIRAEDAVPGEYIVVLGEERLPREASVEVAARDLVAEIAPGAELLRTHERVLGGFVAAMSEADALALSAAPGVEYVEENGYYALAPPDDGTSARAIPDEGAASARATASAREPAFSVQEDASWGLRRIAQRELPIADAYEYDLTGRGVDVYVIDSGIWTSHDDFGDRAREGFSAFDDDYGAEDCHGHGTHVAGTIAGETWGVAKEAELYAVRVFNCEGGTTSASILEGVEWVTENAGENAVVNMSLGTGSEAVVEAIEESVARGIPYVVAAGNHDDDACEVMPARSEDVLTIGATNREDRRSRFTARQASNYGPCVDVFAPGSGIRSAGIRDEGDVAIDSGTSMASPHAAGVAAQFLEQNPSARPRDVYAAIRDSATAGLLRGDIGEGSPNLLLYGGFVGEEGSFLPRVELTAPEEGATLSGTVTIAADAEPGGDGELAGVTFELPDGSIEAVGEPPYELRWDSSSVYDGTYDVIALARAESGASVEVSARARIQNGNEGGDRIWRASDEPALALEDGGEACTSVTVRERGDASTARVSLRGEHSYRADLRGTLEFGGKKVELFGADTFGEGEGTFELEGEPVEGVSGDARGMWTLCIEDILDFGDEGVLESWSVEGEG